ncbi:uncharacterized protein DSM5745_01781 [Aspergillus mulundensis]|uniref:Uncharacterized protein n=1 Tax=Aspergillus mulundensis TaxID=1810919 RepID=A0A3D8SUN6_9EURO|nr:Uncharacterized protein DSM5745_01781 [Aspergillus mulundensis]RDW90006.1 Uncharacterized protein DSM5745_01781 [Aspergillus mulundensis]
MIHIPMFDGAFTLSIDRTPRPLGDATRTLYNRAISNPSSLTDQERRLITRRPPAEEENTLCQKECGLTMDELIAKAINSNDKNTNGPALSNQESRLLLSGVVKGESGRILSERVRLSLEDRDLMSRAMDAATTDDLRVAREAAQRVNQRLTDAWLAAMDTLSNDDIRNLKFAINVPWQEHVLQLQPGSTSAGDSGQGQGLDRERGRFGLVVFYQEGEGQGEGGGGRGRLPEYKSQIETAIHHGLHFSIDIIKDETRGRFALHWVAVPGIGNEELDPSALRSRFSTMLSNSEIPSGFRRDAFLYVDDEAYRSRETARPYLWLAEPEPQPDPQSENGAGTEAQSQPPPPAEALRPLKVDIKHIAPTLFARLVQRDLEGEARRKPYRNTSELSKLHAATQSRARNEIDGIWPPPARYQ